MICTTVNKQNMRKWINENDKKITGNVDQMRGLGDDISKDQLFKTCTLLFCQILYISVRCSFTKIPYKYIITFFMCIK
jgi:hypothetical protein